MAGPSEPNISITRLSACDSTEGEGERAALAALGGGVPGERGRPKAFFLGGGVPGDMGKPKAFFLTALLLRSEDVRQGPRMAVASESEALREEPGVLGEWHRREHLAPASSGLLTSSASILLRSTSLSARRRLERSCTIFLRRRESSSRSCTSRCSALARSARSRLARSAAPARSVCSSHSQACRAARSSSLGQGTASFEGFASIAASWLFAAAFGSPSCAAPPRAPFCCSSQWLRRTLRMATTDCA
mmetsp:Transcript_23717/g.67828  ORF Transcript_23717/g.67828 Transcript_23717/m.67828 type:complete len:247 (-) Transcript_23717:119-859(-)